MPEPPHLAEEQWQWLTVSDVRFWLRLEAKYMEVMMNSVLWSEAAGFGLRVLISQECRLSNLDKAS